MMSDILETMLLGLVIAVILVFTYTFLLIDHLRRIIGGRSNNE
jgi:hypothetical protein